MTELLPGMESERRDPERSQWYTPPAVASRLWAWCSVPSRPGVSVLEPSAGDGALVRPILADLRSVTRVVMYEVDPVRVAQLRALSSPLCALEVRPWSFPDDDSPGSFELAVLNPPYERDQDVDFILHATRHARETVGLYRSAMVHGTGRYNRLWRWVDIRRVAWLSGRPRFGGDFSPLTDFVALQLVQRKHARKQGEPNTCNVEWWA